MRNIYLKKVINNDEMIKNPPSKKVLKMPCFIGKLVLISRPAYNKGFMQFLPLKFGAKMKVLR